MAEKKEVQKKTRFRPKKERKSFANILRDFRGEFKKIVWPTPRQVVKNTTVTLIMVATIGIFIWVLDFVLTFVLKYVYR